LRLVQKRYLQQFSVFTNYSQTFYILIAIQTLIHFCRATLCRHAVHGWLVVCPSHSSFFPYETFCRNTDGIPLNEAVECRCGMENSKFSINNSLYLENDTK